jgi:hypothetical protein
MVLAGRPLSPWPIYGTDMFAPLLKLVPALRWSEASTLGGDRERL